jgi:molybdate transport system substrate-binding protein
VTAHGVVVASLVTLSVAACSSGGGGSPGAARVDLDVYAAASLKQAMAEVESAWEAANPGSRLSVSTDSSSALETKIEQGAPADVFLSADTTNPQKLIDGGFAAGDVTPFANNTLTVIVPSDNPAGIRTPADLAKDGIKIIAAGAHVPITRYATQLVDNLAKEPGYPADFAAGYAANVVSQEDNVAGIVTKVELGEGDAGIVYVTDAERADRVATVEVPDTANVPATYGGVVVRSSPDRGAAAAFLAWLAGSEGQAALAKLGFLPPSP